MHQKCIRNLSQIQPSLPRSQSLKYYKNQNKHTYFFLYYLYLSQIYPKFNLLSLYLTYSNTVKIPNASEMHQKCIRNLSQIQPSLPRSQSLKYYKNQNKHTYFFLYYLYLSQIYPKFNLLSLYLTYSNTVKIPNLSQMHQKCIRNLSQIQPSLPRSQSLKYYKNQNKHTYFFLYYLYLSQIYPKFNLLSLYLTYSNTVKIPNASEMHQKCIRNLSQIQPSLPRSQSLKYYKNQNKHTYFFLYYLYLSQIYPKFNLLSLYLTYSNTVKIPNLSQMHQKCIRNLSQIQPSLPRSQSLKYYKNQNKHTYFFLYYLYLSQIYPKFNLLSLYLTYSNTVKIPNASEMHQKCIRNLSQIQPSLPRSQSLKYYKNQNKHTYFFLYYLYLSQIYPKFNLLSLYLTYSNTVKIPNASEMHQKCIRNLSQIQPSLPRSQSLKYYKNQNKHTYFFLYYLYLSQIYPKFNLLSLYLTYSNTVKIPNTYFFLSYIYPKCIRNVSEIYPKFNLLSLDLSHSNTIKIKTSIHISSYITYIYPKFIPNSTFSPYISLTQIL